MHGEKTANCGDAASVGTEGHLLHVAVGSTADDLFPVGLCVPHFHRIVAACGEPPTIGAELDSSYRPRKAERTRLLPRVHVPNLQFPFLIGFPTACGGQALTIRAEA